MVDRAKRAAAALLDSRAAPVVSSRPRSDLRVREITEADHEPVAMLLGKGFQRPTWYYMCALERLSRHPTPAGWPKYGIMMEANGAPVGAVLLVFSTIQVDGGTRTRCNVTSWYVEPEYKAYAAVFTSRALRHKNITYVNVSARPATRPIIKAQGFSTYSGGQYLAIPALHFGAGQTSARIVRFDTSPDVHFASTDRELLSAHAEYGCMSLWCMTSERAYPFVFLPRLFKRFLPGAQLIYCRDIEDLVQFSRPLGRYLASRGILVIRVDSNGPISGLIGKYFKGQSPRFFKGPEAPRLGDIAYTQAAMFPWPWPKKGPFGT
jgi:hypothetical protein